MIKFFRKNKNNINNEGRWSISKPTTGGISFFICFLISVMSLVYTTKQYSGFSFLEFYGIMFACITGFLAGLFDDAYKTVPWFKFAMQLLCAFILIYTNTYVKIFDMNLLNYAITVLWVVGIMNAINLLDNMDAISTIVSVSIISLLIIIIAFYYNINHPYLFILIGVLASLFGFLKFNWYPSKAYMGDTGSIFLGIFLAAFGIIFIWNFQIPDNIVMPLIPNLLAPVIIFSLPIIDTTTVFFKRLIINKKSPFIGGKDHTTHHLSYLGLSDRSVALIFAGISFINIIMGLLIFKYSVIWNNFFTITFGSYFVLLFGFLFIITNINNNLIKD